MTIRIKTDRKWKQFKYRYEVPGKVLEDQFSYWTPDQTPDDGYFCYRGNWYHLDDFMVSSDEDLAKLWDGVNYDSYFSGVVIKVSKDGETYQVGTYMS
jgi:hypothetical protein